MSKTPSPEELDAQSTRALVRSLSCARGAHEPVEGVLLTGLFETNTDDRFVLGEPVNARVCRRCACVYAERVR